MAHSAIEQDRAHTGGAQRREQAVEAPLPAPEKPRADHRGEQPRKGRDLEGHIAQKGAQAVRVDHMRQVDAQRQRAAGRVEDGQRPRQRAQALCAARQEHQNALTAKQRHR